jgi:hypothetical protein
VRRPAKDEMVYFIQEVGNPEGLIKIGQSEMPRLRLTALQTGSPVHLGILKVIPDAYDDGSYHGRFRSAGHHGEWFTPTPELVAFIAALPESPYDGLQALAWMHGKTLAALGL